MRFLCSVGDQNTNGGCWSWLLSRCWNVCWRLVSHLLTSVSTRGSHKLLENSVFHPVMTTSDMWVKLADLLILRSIFCWVSQIKTHFTEGTFGISAWLDLLIFKTPTSSGTTLIFLFCTFDLFILFLFLTALFFVCVFFSPEQLVDYEWMNASYNICRILTFFWCGFCGVFLYRNLCLSSSNHRDSLKCQEGYIH